jgi:hypothetical protein
MPLCPGQSRFLEAPFVSMLRMRSASLKMQLRTILLSYEKCVILRIEHTPGFHIMRIHLVRYLTSARVENNPQNFTYCEFIQLVQIKRHCLLSKN